MLLLLILTLACGLQPQSVGSAQTGHIRGVIVDARSGRPIARVRVDVQNSPVTTQTNDQGRFEIDVPAGTLTLSVSGVGYALTKREVTVPAGTSISKRP